MPRLDRQRAMALADAAAQRGAAERFELLLSLTEMALARLARTGATGAPPAPEAAPQEAAMLQRLSPDRPQGPGLGGSGSRSDGACAARAGGEP